MWFADDVLLAKGYRWVDTFSHRSRRHSASRSRRRMHPGAFNPTLMTDQLAA
jgi:hypothetical protein